MKTDYDAIVVGSGISGGWAAKELTEKGLKVLVLERGRDIRHGRDYTTEHIAPWDIPFGGKPLRELYQQEYAIQKDNYAFDETTRHFFNNDKQNPYSYDKDKPFKWIRAGVKGGKSLLWGRQVYRFSDLDFEANKKDGHGIDWPIRYADIAPWYSYVEKFAGISGEKLGLPQLPDGEFQRPMAMNVIEKHVKKAIETNYPDRHMTIGRVAVHTEAKNGRAACHYCGPCERGCSVGAYFSSLSSTLPAAERTGNLTQRCDSVVEGIDYNPKTGRASGVRVIDANTREKITFTGRLVFLCASTVASTQILLTSRSEHFPNGLANSSGVLGRYLMDHVIGSGAMGIFMDYLDKLPTGNRPNGIYIPRFRNLDGQDKGVDFLRGYGYQGAGMRLGWQAMQGQIPGFGKDFKHALRMPGPWTLFLAGFGECLPRYENRLYLDDTKRDNYGIAQVAFDATFGDNEKRMRGDIAQQAQDMLKAAGAAQTIPINIESAFGEAIHEMGTARMGDDPKQSVLNRWNQAHDVPNLFVTDGSCMTSASCVNPSITYMALTARAADYAVKQLRSGAL